MKGQFTTAVLRFSEQEGPAIELHKDILEASGIVWWGWWKKQFEPNREAFLVRLKKRVDHGPLDVALLNRKDERYYTARIVGVEFRRGENTSAPGPECPTRFRDIDGGLPAWFKFSNITEIDEREYTSRYGPVPTGEPTLYEVRKDETGKCHVYPQPSWSMEPTDAPGNVILHLSDLHFGDFHGFQHGTITPGTKPDRPTLMHRVRQVVDQLTENVGAVVVSGDLVSRGVVEDFYVVEDFLNELLSELHLSKNHIVCVPGNHDFMVIEEGTLPTVDYGHERPYRAFVERFYGETGTEIERLARFRFPIGRDAVFALLNSARLRGHESKEYGYVGRHRYEEMLDYMEERIEVEGHPTARFAVLHHHLVPVRELDVPRTGTPVSLTVDAAELFSELQERGFDGALHGHQHLPFFMRGTRSVFMRETELAQGRRELAIVGCGASGARTLNPEFAFNALGTYTLTETGMEGTFWRYTDRNRPTSFANFTVPWEV